MKTWYKDGSKVWLYFHKTILQARSNFYKVLPLIDFFGM